MQKKIFDFGSFVTFDCFLKNFLTFLKNSEKSELKGSIERKGCDNFSYKSGDSSILCSSTKIFSFLNLVEKITKVLGKVQFSKLTSSSRIDMKNSKNIKYVPLALAGR